MNIISNLKMRSKLLAGFLLVLGLMIASVATAGKKQQTEQCHSARLDGHLGSNEIEFLFQ